MRLISTLLITILNLILPPKVFAIDCFKCVSLNGSYKPCEDPFHNNYTTDIYQSPCMGAKKGRDGVFPATSCIKIMGKFVESGDTIVVRGCALDSGTLTTDTEIVRMSHCGGFHYEHKYAEGCVQSCNDADACNSSTKARTVGNLTLILLYITSKVMLF